MTEIRTRFAPSPTGALHLGNARTAVFNWLYTRHNGGALVLRIEDTDVARNVEGSHDSIYEDLRWLGIEWDEGPDIGGPHAPYRQSERGALYSSAADRLVESGQAYPCYCTSDENAREPEESSTGESHSRYPGTCRSLSAEERAERARDSGPPLIRFNVPAEEILVQDVVRGDVAFPAGDFGDFVLVRRDGRPTYNFAVVVDDVEMRITDVIRGIGHLSNTPKQAVLFDALGEPRPRFAHLPLVLGQDRRKLSKREDALSLAKLRAEGYPPTALVNYLSLLGWSSPDGEEVLDVDELADRVDLDRVGASNTVIDPEKLRWIASQHVARMPIEEVVANATPYIDSARAPLTGEDLAEAIDIVRTRISVFGEINEHLSFFHPAPGPELDRARAEVRTDPEAAGVLRAVSRGLETIDTWEPAEVSKAIRAVGKSVGARGPALFHPVRKAVTGRESGPDIGRVMGVLGRDETLARIAVTLERSTV